MLMRLSPAILVALSLASTVTAQEAAQEPPPSAEQLAAASARADAIIVAADAGQFFVNSSRDGMARVTHKLSGLTCMFSGSAQDRITIYPVVSAEVPRGYDVGCSSYDESLKVDWTVYATRYRPMISEDQAIQTAAMGIQQRWPDARPFEGPIPIMSGEGNPAPKVAVFTITNNGEPALTAAFVTHRDEWAFKSRATGPAEPEMAVPLYANLVLMTGVLDRQTSSTTAD